MIERHDDMVGGKTNDNHITVHTIGIIAQLTYLRTMARVESRTHGVTHFQAIFVCPVIDPIINTVTISGNGTYGEPYI